MGKVHRIKRRFSKIVERQPWKMLKPGSSQNFRLPDHLSFYIGKRIARECVCKSRPRLSRHASPTVLSFHQSRKLEVEGICLRGLYGRFFMEAMQLNKVENMLKCACTLF